MSGWTALLGVTATVFTAPSFAIFSDLMTGWVLGCSPSPTRTAGGRAHDAYHRFVRAGVWVTGRLWRVLAVHAAGLCCPDGVLELLVDDTLAHKSGRKVAGAGVLRDAVRSTKNRVVYAWGLNVVVVCLRVTPPWGGTPIAEQDHPGADRGGGHWTVEDDGLSRNGTFVNGTRLSSRVRLRDRDKIMLGGTIRPRPV